MGYVRKRKLYRLVFDDEEFAGLEVVTKAGSVGAYEQIASLANRKPGQLTEDDLEKTSHLYREFAKVLVSWNVEEHEDPLDESSPLIPVPATVDGLMAQDLPFVLAIILAWMDAVASTLVGPTEGQMAELEASLSVEPLPA